MRDIRVLLPALGNPMGATSAMSLSSMSSQRSSATSPCSAKEGARRRLDRKRALPLPPRPPRAASHRSPAATRSASASPPLLRTTVPSGTFTTASAPRAPCLPFPWPWPPFSARRWGWSLKASSEATSRSATSHTSPPEPPSPPSGPPRATWASRRKLMAPAPPSPPLTWSWASSANSGTHARVATGLSPTPRTPPKLPAAAPASAAGRSAGAGMHVHQLATLAAGELHGAVGGGEQRVVATPAHVEPGVELGAPLADEDGPGPHRGAVEGLDAEALGGRVTAVAGRASTFGLGHEACSSY